MRMVIAAPLSAVGPDSLCKSNVYLTFTRHGHQLDHFDIIYGP